MYQSDLMPIHATNDADLYALLRDVSPTNGDGKFNQWDTNLSFLNWDWYANTRTVVVYPCKLLIYGRLIEITEQLSITVGTDIGDGYIYLSIDLTKANTATGEGNNYRVTNNQLVYSEDPTKSALQYAWRPALGGFPVKGSPVVNHPIIKFSDANSPHNFEWDLPGRTAMAQLSNREYTSGIQENDFWHFQFHGTHGRRFYIEPKFEMIPTDVDPFVMSATVASVIAGNKGAVTDQQFNAGGAAVYWNEDSQLGFIWHGGISFRWRTAYDSSSDLLDIWVSPQRKYLLDKETNAFPNNYKVKCTVKLIPAMVD